MGGKRKETKEEARKCVGEGDETGRVWRERERTGANTDRWIGKEKGKSKC